jgi:hypothetical protein
MHHHSCVSGAPSTTTATIWSAGLRAASAIRPPILDQAEILHREEVLMTAKISATAKAFTTPRRAIRYGSQGLSSPTPRGLADASSDTLT